MKKTLLALAIVVGLMIVDPGHALALRSCFAHVERSSTSIRYISHCDKGRGLQRSKVWLRQADGDLILRFGRKVGRGRLSRSPWAVAALVDEAGIEHWTRSGGFVRYNCRIGCPLSVAL